MSAVIDSQVFLYQSTFRVLSPNLLCVTRDVPVVMFEMLQHEDIFS